jgi:hypothetical protein
VERIEVLELQEQITALSVMLAPGWAQALS